VATRGVYVPEQRWPHEQKRTAQESIDDDCDETEYEGVAPKGSTMCTARAPMTARSVAVSSTALALKAESSAMTPSAAAMSLGDRPDILTTRSFKRAQHGQARRKRDLDF